MVEVSEIETSFLGQADPSSQIILPKYISCFLVYTLQRVCDSKCLNHASEPTFHEWYQDVQVLKLSNSFFPQ